jgi:aminopeptidase N
MIKPRHLLLSLSFVAFIPPEEGIAQEKERPRAYDVLHYDITIRIDEVKKGVDGFVNIRLVPLRLLDSLSIDAAEMEILGVIFRDDDVHISPSYSYDGSTIMVQAPSAISEKDTVLLTVRYRCFPRTGLHFVSPDEAYPNKPWQVWSQGEMEDNHFWFPCYDYPNDRATVDMRVTVNERFLAISNGTLVTTTHDRKSRTKTYHWSSPQPFVSYLISLVVGEYVKIEESSANIPVQYYVYPDQVYDAARSFSKTPQMVSFFSEKLGFRYPWSKYAQTVVADFIYGGMENTDATTLTDKTIHSGRAGLDVSSDGLVAHELAHQWFGNLVTCQNWSHIWLNEGFATYMTAVWSEADKGFDEFQYNMMRNQQEVMESDTGLDRRPTVTDRYSNPGELFDSRVYDRGACILHMLRAVMGDTAFWKGMQAYLVSHQFDEVTTADFQKSMEEAHGADLSWFFDQWTTRAGFPELEVFHRYDADARRLHITVRQKHTVDDLTPLYRLPVDVEVVTAKGSTLHRLTVEPQAEQTLSISSDQVPLNVVFDKGNLILKKLDDQKSTKEWLYQVIHGDAAGRMEALKVLEKSINEPEVRAAVARALVADSFWGVREGAAKALGKSTDVSILNVLAPAFQDSVANVREAATASLKSFKTLDALVALGSILASDSSYEVLAEAITSLVAIDSVNGMTYCEKGLMLESHNEVIRAASLKAMGKLTTADARERLIGFTAYGKPLEVRQAAIEALARNWKQDDDVRIHLEELLMDPIQRVQRKAIEELGMMASQRSREPLADFLKSTVDAILKREATKALLKIERAAMAASSQGVPLHKDH